MEHEPQVAVRQDTQSTDQTRPYATWTAQIARMVAVVAIEVALQQALGPLFLRRS